FMAPLDPFGRGFPFPVGRSTDEEAVERFEAKGVEDVFGSHEVLDREIPAEPAIGIVERLAPAERIGKAGRIRDDVRDDAPVGNSIVREEGDLRESLQVICIIKSDTVEPIGIGSVIEDPPSVLRYAEGAGLRGDHLAMSGRDHQIPEFSRSSSDIDDHLLALQDAEATQSFLNIGFRNASTV